MRALREAADGGRRKAAMMWPAYDKTKGSAGPRRDSGILVWAVADRDSKQLFENNSRPRRDSF